jgi:hypothetical protein
MEYRVDPFPEGGESLSLLLQADGHLFCVCVSSDQVLKITQTVGALQAALGHFCAANKLDSRDILPDCTFVKQGELDQDPTRKPN